jgi:hypothetical protein
LFGIGEQLQGTSKAGESSLGGTPDEKPLGALDTERLFNQETPLTIEALLAKHPPVVVEKFVSLMESINDGKKAIYHSLEIQALSIETPEDEPITRVYLGKVADKDQNEWYNLLDSQGDYVSSANWRIASLIKDDLKQYVDEVRRAFLEVELKTLFGEIFDLASQSEDATIFLKSIAESQGLKSPTGRKLMQKLFGIAQEDSKMYVLKSLKIGITLIKNKKTMMPKLHYEIVLEQYLQQHQQSFYNQLVLQNQLEIYLNQRVQTFMEAVEKLSQTGIDEKLAIETNWSLLIPSH